MKPPRPAGGGRRSLYLTGPALITAGLCLNPWTLAWVMGRDEAFSLPTRLGIGIFDLLLIGTGCLFLRFRIRIPAGVALINLAGFALVLALAEAAVLLALKAILPLPDGAPMTLVRHLYQQDKNIIQYSPGCARHDRELGYTLRPGACTFSNVEFEIAVAVNSLGLRDDEASLEAPQIIVLGDSHAMGWGVEASETFPEVLARRTGRKVLNAAISSYGTARELITLKRLDTSQLEALIIQYSNNDLLENRTFLDNGADLPVVNEHEYSAVIRRHGRKKRYLFGSHLLGLMRERLIDPVLNAAAGYLFPQSSDAVPDAAEAKDNRVEAETFLDVLDACRERLPQVPLLVIEINGYNANDPELIEALSDALASRAPGIELQLLDASSFLTPDHYYRLDDHLNASGHQAVAEALLERLPG